MDMALVLEWLSFSELYSLQFEILLKHSRKRVHEYKSFGFEAVIYILMSSGTIYIKRIGHMTDPREYQNQD